ncbi:respiratory chain complex I subunit 1 family protein [Spirochaeta isovalerica]|uniref:NADH-quinone oxidoreductase subunit H n=1 Tax=Spirochaeta isovalerica TaxID=150 RepID=A0A841RKB9_9SPIO|nr:complex I subunit 1 family protein [Spirochaeta isovalerica]MBB6482712.1 NADH-quinone oxidoreductase subunit H [Spirochaeta isovalerica]
MSSLTTRILYAVLSIFIVMNIGLVLQGVTRKIYARVNKRYGIRIYQPYIDLIKNYSLDTLVSHGVMYYLGPIFRLTSGVGLVLFIPLIYGSEHFSNFSFSGDAVLILYFLFFGTLGMALGANETGQPYSAIGVARGLSQVTAAEIPLVLSFLAVFLQNGTLSLSQIVEAQQGGIMHWTMWTNPIATATAMLAFLGSMMRSPFDVVLAPQEIPIGPPTEFHGKFLGILQTNRSIFPIAKTILYVNLFFGGATNWGMFILKCFLLYMWSVIVGTIFPRYRVDHSIRWFLKWPLALGLLSILFVQLV